MSVLPDRERRHLLQFWIAPRLAYGPRLGWALGFGGTGFLLQVLLAPSSQGLALVGGCGLLFAGNLFLLVRGYDLEPQVRALSGEWEKTTRDRFRVIVELEGKVRGWDETFADVTCITGAAILALLGLVMAGALAAIAANDSLRPWFLFLAVDAAVLILPHWFTGTRRGWRPVALTQEIKVLETALRAIERYEDPACQIQPMLNVVAEREGQRRVPWHARVFVRFPDGPEDFLGLQFQVSLNDVQGTKYPYLYAVLVARKKLELGSHYASRIRAVCSDLTVEENREEDVDVLVVRQRTTKNSGYHTDSAAVRRIANAAWRSAALIALDEQPAAS